MSLRDDRYLRIQAVKKANLENAKQLELAKNNAAMNEANISNYTKRIKQVKREHELRIQELEKRLQRAIDNAKHYHEVIDSLIEEKEKIHNDLKKAIDYGEVQCEYCKFYFKSEESLSRHQKTCISRPDIKAVEEHKIEIKEKRDDLIARKKALERELKEIKDFERETKESAFEPEEIKEDQLNIIKQVKEQINEKISELDPNKVQCPECKEWFTKGGAFATHYRSHFNGNNEE